MDDKILAHTSPDGGESQGLMEHAEGVAEIACNFVAKALGEEWQEVGYALGMLHDFGKYQKAFQTYLRDPKREKAPHSVVGARLALSEWEDSPKLALALAYCISGHHRGLYDHSEMMDRLKYGKQERLRTEKSLEAAGEEGQELLARLKALAGLCDEGFDEVEDEDYQLLIRVLFSCLVDADYLDTEAFMAPEQGQKRRDSSRNVLNTPWEMLIEQLRQHTDKFKADTKVNRARAHFLTQCREHGAVSARGLYSLYLPTGGGKTLSSLAWAMEAARQHRAERIIYVIPYTSIITQTAEVFRSIFGQEYVLEHHSNIDWDKKKDKEDKKNEDDGELYSQTKLLSENWDMPIVVTTNVQFFESLFAHKTSRLRKVHNMCNAIIVFDEVQMFPTELQTPMLRVMESLLRLGGSSLLLCTATQPIFSEHLDMRHTQMQNYYHFREEVEDVVPYDEELFRVFDRVHYELPILELGLDALAERLAEEGTALCVVNTRRDAALLMQAVQSQRAGDSEGLIHLSRMMCTAHLDAKIQLIKQRLREGLPTLVISTQLIEAGVDLDFPVVYRALCGIDSIIQAGGRCNREGKMMTKGKVYTFSLSGGSSPFGNLAEACQATKDIMRTLQGEMNPNEPELVRDYYRKYFTRVGNFDKYSIKPMLWHSSYQRKLKFSFEEASQAFTYIDDEGKHPIVVPYGIEGEELVNKIRDRIYLDRKEIRKLQGLQVSLHERQVEELLRYGRVEAIPLWGEAQEPILLFTDREGYSDLLGVVLENHYQTDNLMC